VKPVHGRAQGAGWAWLGALARTEKDPIWLKSHFGNENENGLRKTSNISNKIWIIIIIRCIDISDI
jgi:hypothetical protein